MIPIFPKFKHIDLVDKEEIESVVKQYPPYADFSFINLWSYDVENDLLLSNLNSNLVVRFLDYTSTSRFYSFIGTNDVRDTIDKLLNLASKENVLPYLKLIPENVIASDNSLSNSFHISEDRDNFDYVISLNNLSTMPSSQYRIKRQVYNKFIRTHRDIRFERINNINHDQLINTFYLWEKNKGLSRENTLHELSAINKLLSIIDSLDLHTTAAYDNDSMIGFFINEIAHNNHAIGHFIKVNPLIEGIYNFFYKSAADMLLQNSCTYINLQQDLGIKGLRTAKQLWHPSYFLKKYTISNKYTNDLSENHI